MKRVTGIGGVFIKATDPQKLQAWYEEHLGLKAVHGAVIFQCPSEPEEISRAQTVWAIFGRDTKYFEPSRADFMINFRVENLTALIEQLRAEGVEVDERTEEYEHGRFGWIQDPEGNRIELWEPPAANAVEEAK
jgi:catechol 2,3-dioxygenase-like lactoylglutathione lyase family enzyme